jgi:colanic acid biosynthesis glycosyl transferase WcaI
VRVAILTQYYPPEVGAPQVRLSSLARRLRARGHDVIVLAAMPNYPGGRIFPGYRGFTRTDEIDGVRVTRSWIIPSKSASMQNRLVSYFSFAISSLVIGAWMLPRVDYLITESPPLFLGPTGFVLSRLKRARWILNVSDLWPDSVVMLGITSSPVALRLARALERFCYRHAVLVTGQTRGIVQAVGMRAPNVKTHYFPNGVDIDLFNEPAKQAEGTADDCKFLYAGLHGLAQGLDRVLDAAALLESRDGAHFDFVGDGPTKEALVARAAAMRLGAVRFLDPVPHRQVPALLAEADVAIVPLALPIEEAVPSKLYEAMAAGTAVLLVADGEAVRLLEEAGAGVAVPPGDAEKIAQAMERLIADPEERARMGSRGRAFVERFDRRAINDGLISLLESGLEGDNPLAYG